MSFDKSFCLFLALLIIGLPGLAYGVVGTYQAESVNALGEPELMFRFRQKNKTLVTLRIPDRRNRFGTWHDSGRLELNWENCRTKDALLGSGDLNQCFRRGSLRYLGKRDRLSPGFVKIQRMSGNRLAFWLQMEGQLPLSFVANMGGGGFLS